MLQVEQSSSFDDAMESISTRMIQGPARRDRSTPRSYHPSRDSCFFELETNWSSTTLAELLLPKKVQHCFRYVSLSFLFGFSQVLLFIRYFILDVLLWASGQWVLDWKWLPEFHLKISSCTQHIFNIIALLCAITFIWILLHIRWNIFWFGLRTFSFCYSILCLVVIKGIAGYVKWKASPIPIAYVSTTLFLFTGLCVDTISFSRLQKFLLTLLCLFTISFEYFIFKYTASFVKRDLDFSFVTMFDIYFVGNVHLLITYSLSMYNILKQPHRMAIITRSNPRLPTQVTGRRTSTLYLNTPRHSMVFASNTVEQP